MREEIRQIQQLDSPSYDSPSEGVCQPVQQFLLSVEKLQASIASETVTDIDVAVGDRLSSKSTSQQPVGQSIDQSIDQSINQLQRQFQEIIAAAEAACIDPQIEQRVRPFLTEGHRRLRLAGIAAMQLRTAKQPVTVKKQRSLIQAHLSQLQQFAQAIADEVCLDEVRPDR